MSTIDPDAVAQLRRMGGDDLVLRIVAVFLEQGDERVAGAEAALARADREGVRQACHALRSSALQLGAAALAEACLAGEAAARTEGSSSAVAMAGAVVRLRPELEAAVQAFRRLAGTPAAERRATPAGGALVAVVEDNEDNRVLLRALLEDRYELQEFASGPEALGGMRGRVPAVVLMDISLPGMDGVQVLEAMRRDAALQHVPVIALTAHAMSGDRERFLSAGFDAYFTKPIIDDDALLESLRVLAGAGSAA